MARFAELHDGGAWVEERSGGGASFRVFLPTQPAGYRPEPVIASVDAESSGNSGSSSPNGDGQPGVDAGTSSEDANQA